MPSSKREGLLLVLDGTDAEGTAIALEKARRHAPVQTTRLPERETGDFAGEPPPDDLFSEAGARRALRAAGYALMVSAHFLADCDDSVRAELAADLDEQWARLDAARRALLDASKGGAS